MNHDARISALEENGGGGGSQNGLSAILFKCQFWNHVNSRKCILIIIVRGEVEMEAQIYSDDL